MFPLSLYMRRPTYTQSTASGALIPTSLYMVHFRVLPDYLNRAVIIPLRVRKKKSKIKCVLDLIYVISIVALVFFVFLFWFPPPFINLVWNTTPPVSDQSFDRKIFPTRPPPPPTAAAAVYFDNNPETPTDGRRHGTDHRAHKQSRDE